MARTANPELARQWRERLTRFERSDLTIADFCDDEGYSTASFYSWRRRLRSQPPPTPAAFIAVEMPDQEPVFAEESKPNQTMKVQIDLPGGAVINLPKEIPDRQRCQWIAAVVRATTDPLAADPLAADPSAAESSAAGLSAAGTGGRS